MEDRKLRQQAIQDAVTVIAFEKFHQYREQTAKRSIWKVLREQTILTLAHRLPNFLDAVSPMEVTLGIVRMLGAAAVGGVLLLAKLVTGNMPSKTDYFVSTVIWMLQLFSVWYDKIHKKPSEAKSLNARRVDNNMSLARVIEKLLLSVSVREDLSRGVSRLLPGEVATLQKLILQGIREQIRVALKDINSHYFEVSLLTFTDESGQFLRVTERAGGRSLGAIKSCDKVLGYGAFIAGVFAEHDFKYTAFTEKHSISAPQHAPPYRSILFIPIFSEDGYGHKSALGVVTIDSAKPFHFYYSETLLRSMIEPDVAILRFLLEISAPRVNIPS